MVIIQHGREGGTCKRAFFCRGWGWGMGSKGLKEMDDDKLERECVGGDTSGDPLCARHDHEQQQFELAPDVEPGRKLCARARENRFCEDKTVFRAHCRTTTGH